MLWEKGWGRFICGETCSGYVVSNAKKNRKWGVGGSVVFEPFF